MILFLISIISERVAINDPFKSQVQTPDKSPLEYTFKPGLGLAMIYWPDATINISDETMSKNISILDGIHVFTFGRQTDVTITFREDVLFYVFRYPVMSSNKIRTLYPICEQYSNTPSLDVDEETEIYYTAYSDYYIDLGISFSSGEVTVEYDKGIYPQTEKFQKTFYFRPDFALHDLKISSTAKFSLGHLTINCTKTFDSTNSRFVAVDVYRQSRDMSRGHFDYKNTEDNSILISDIKPKNLHTLRIDTTKAENDGFKISYKYSPDDPDFITINSHFYAESTKQFKVYLYATSMTSNYPDCKKAPLDEAYYSTIYYQESLIHQNILPSICQPPIARIIIYQNRSELEFILDYKIGNGINEVKRDEFSYVLRYDFNITLLATRYDLCKYIEIKTYEIKVGDQVQVNITNEDIPRACMKTDKNSICFAEKTDYQKCLDAVEGRVIEPEYGSRPGVLYDPGENYTILIFRNATGDSSIFMNQHDVIFGPDYFLDLKYVNQISGSQETNLIIDNLSFDPSDVDRLLLQSKHFKIMPSTGQPVGPIQINGRDDFILEAMDAEADSSKYPNILVSKYCTINVHDYPLERLLSNSYIINGVYIICNYESENSNCPKDFYNTYKIHNVSLTAVEMKLQSFLYIFLDTFEHDVDIDINKFNNQKIYIVENSNSNQLLEEKPKIRFTSAKNISVDYFDLSFGNGTHNTLSIGKIYNDIFTIVCEDYLTVSNLVYDRISINVEPVNDNSIIFYDESINHLDYITLNVDMKNIKKVNVYFGNSNVDTSLLHMAITCGGEQCNKSNLEYKYGIPPGLNSGSDSDDNEPNNGNKGGDDKKGLDGGAIAGIVIAIIVVIAAVIIAVIFIMKKKNRNDSTNEIDDNQEIKDL